MPAKSNPQRTPVSTILTPLERSRVDAAAQGLHLLFRSQMKHFPAVQGIQNTDGNALFVSHTPAPSGATNGEFDDQFTWITVGEIYGRLIAAGKLP